LRKKWKFEKNEKTEENFSIEEITKIWGKFFFKKLVKRGKWKKLIIVKK